MGQCLICPVCFGQFCTEAADPITLFCGHSVCNICLTGLKNSEWAEDEGMFECPVCRHEHYYNEVEDYKLPVNQTVIKLVNQYRKTKHRLKGLKREQTGKTDNVFGQCQKHNLPVHFGCVPCFKLDLCGQCLLNSHQNEDTCQVYPIEAALWKIKEDIFKKCVTTKDSNKTRPQTCDQLYESVQELINNFEYMVNCNSVERMTDLNFQKKTDKFMENVTFLQEFESNIRNSLDGESPASYEECYNFMEKYQKVKRMIVEKKPFTNFGFFRWADWLQVSHIHVLLLT